LFGWVFTAGAGGAQELGYVATCGALTASLALAIAVIAARFPRAEVVGLGLWTGASGLLLMGPVPAIALALIVAGTLWAWSIRPAVAGVIVGSALALAVVVLPRATGQLNIPALEIAGTAWVGPMAAALGIVGACAYERARRRSPRLPSAALLCLLVLAATSPILWVKATERSWNRGPRFAMPEGMEGRPSIILLILDTVRADRLSVYGFEHDTTPNLAGLLARHANAVVVERAIAPANWTLPTHASLFSGLRPAEHGLHAASTLVNGRVSNAVLRAEKTVAEQLREAGYATGCVFANGFLDVGRGLERGFDWYARPDAPLPLPMAGEALRRRLLPGYFVKNVAAIPRADAVNEGILRFFDACGKRGCFLVANFMEAHAPYAPAALFTGPTGFAGGSDRNGPVTNALTAAEREWLDRRYQGEIRGLDTALGALFADLDSRGLLRDSWLFVTSDHGEAFGEHGLTEHGTSLYGEETWVPLIIKPPAGVTIELAGQVVSLLDLPATIASIAGAAYEGHGRDLTDSSTVGHATVEFYGDARKARAHGRRAAHPGRAVVSEGWKLLEHGGRRELYDLERDPFEEHDLIEREPGIARRLAPMLPTLEAPSPTRESGTLSKEQEDRLRALGYVE